MRVSICFILIIVDVNIFELAATEYFYKNLNNIAYESTGENYKEFRSNYGKLMMKFMNTSVKPCDDFYEYACGNWQNHIERHQAQHKRNSLLDIDYKLLNIARNIITNSTHHTHFESELKLARTFYNSCINATLIPLRKSIKYLEVVADIGGFPAIDLAWDSNRFDWFAMSAHLSNFGVIGFINDEIIPQYPFLPYFKFPELGFDIMVHTDNMRFKNQSGYILNKRRMELYLTLYGVESERMETIIDDIFELWQSILSIGDKFVQDFDLCNNQFLTETSDLFVRWQSYYDIAWMGKNFDLPEADCPCHYFYNELDKICNKRKEAVANYLALKLLYSLDAKLEDEDFQEDYCISLSQEGFIYLIDEIYFKDYLHENIRNEIDKMIKEIRLSLQSVLQSADWLDNATRAEALQKEASMKTRIGKFYDPILTRKLISEIGNLTFNENSFEENHIKLKKFKYYMKRYNGNHFDQLENDTLPLELLVGMQVNAFYYNIDNSINVMAGILHPPAYHNSWPIALKYGTLGYLIGHEFTHGFDSVGSAYDNIGNERHWWTKRSGQAFKDRADCFVEHFSKYVIPEINQNLKGDLTKDENIADSGGLRQAWMAYHRHMKKMNLNSAEWVFPDLNLSSDQLFFIGFAQLWCSSYKEEHYWEELIDVHPIDKYRVLGTLTHMPEFSNIFECAIGSPMNPEMKKCKLW